MAKTRSYVKGGDKADAALAAIAKKLANRNVKVGFLAKSKYPDGTPVALVAAVQNYGSMSRGIPPRPFFSGMVEEEAPGWTEKLKALLIAHDYDLDKVLPFMGEEIAGQLRDRISTFVGTPLSPKTIKRKGSEKQLVDTGDMLKSVDYEITKGKPR